MTPQEFVDTYRIPAEHAAELLHWTTGGVLSQWALESGWGTSFYCVRGHNMAGVQNEYGQLVMFPDIQAFIRAYVVDMRNDCPLLRNATQLVNQEPFAVLRDSLYNSSIPGNQAVYASAIQNVYITSIKPIMETLQPIPPTPEPTPVAVQELKVDGRDVPIEHVTLDEKTDTVVLDVNGQEETLHVETVNPA